MRNRTERRGRTIEAALITAKRYPELLTVSSIAKLLARLAECDRRIRAAREEEYHARSSRRVAASIQHLKDELRNEHLRIMARRGRKVMGSAPGAEGAFRAPGTRARADVVVASSRAMLKVIGRRQKLFDGLVEPDFFRLMKSRTDELDREWRARDRGRKAWTSALDEAERATSEGRETLDLLTTYIVAHFRHNRRIINHWRIIVRVKGRIGRPKRKPPKGAGPQES